MVNNVKLISLFLYGWKNRFFGSRRLFFRFSVILGYCMNDVGFGFDYKIADTVSYFSVNRHTSTFEPLCVELSVSVWLGLVRKKKGRKTTRKTSHKTCIHVCVERPLAGDFNHRSRIRDSDF